MAVKQVRHQRSRRKVGRCVYGGCPERTGTFYRCKKHAAEHAKAQRDRRQARKQTKAAA